ncbi:MAG: hypothetical protein ACRBB4_15785 [Neptuniibacter sp.]
MSKEIFILHWLDYETEITHTPSKYKCFEEAYGYAMSHVEIKTIKPEQASLPITDTGYRSIYITAPELTDHGGAKAFILKALNDAAANPAWKSAELQRRQLSLF